MIGGNPLAMCSLSYAEFCFSVSPTLLSGSGFTSISVSNVFKYSIYLWLAIRLSFVVMMESMVRKLNLAIYAGNLPIPATSFHCSAWAPSFAMNFPGEFDFCFFNVSTCDSSMLHLVRN